MIEGALNDAAGSIPVCPEHARLCDRPCRHLPEDNDALDADPM
jgi:hypothetical protein